MQYSNYVAPTGRVLSYLKNPEVVLPASCTVFMLEEGIPPIRTLLHYVGKALVTAAGVNVHLNGFNSSISKYYDVIEPSFDGGILVQDSMFFDYSEEGDLSIIGAISDVFSSCLRGTASYDLSLIRPEGAVSSSGQVASGPESFKQIYIKAYEFAKEGSITSLLSILSKMNEVIRRGGAYKNGAVTTSLPVWHDDILEYLKTNPGKDHPWLKKGVVLPRNYRDVMSKEAIKEMVKAVNRGDLYLEKAVSHKDNRTWLTFEECLRDGYLLSNVCREVLLDSRGTCILTPVNLGQIRDPQQLTPAFLETMELLIKFHSENHVRKAGIYLDASVDKQVGMGLIGLANMLSLAGISYKDFVEALEYLRKEMYSHASNGVEDTLDLLSKYTLRCEGSQEDNVMCWAAEMVKAYIKASVYASRKGMNRAFAIAPTAGVSYRNKDYRGYTTAPEISPPVARKVEPLTTTNTHDRGIYDYGKVETASEVGEDIYFRLAECFQWMQDIYGLGHAYSFNLWSEMDYDFLDRWADSNLKTTYYLLEIEQDFLDKSDQVQSCGLTPDSCQSCGG